MKCWLGHRFGTTETVKAAKLPIPKDRPSGNDPLLTSANTEVTLYRRSCSRCGLAEAWCVTLDKKRIDLNQDDIRVQEQFDKEKNADSKKV